MITHYGWNEKFCLIGKFERAEPENFQHDISPVWNNWPGATEGLFCDVKAAMRSCPYRMRRALSNFIAQNHPPGWYYSSSDDDKQFEPLDGEPIPEPAHGNWWSY